VIIRHDGQTFQLPADVLQNDPPEVRTSIRSAN
jgi:hypothetical protein